MIGAQKRAEVTCNQSEEVKGAQAIACAVFLARTGTSKEEIDSIPLDEELIDEIQKHYRIDMTCQGSMLQAIHAFPEQNNH